MSSPRLGDDNERPITRATPFDDLPSHRASVRATSRYIVRADVADFYGSIYTHAISWAVHGKEEAKRFRNDGSLLGNRLDRLVRNGQYGQTVGIPVGPDTSHVFGELILARVDQALAGQGCSNAFRYMDDYELGAMTLAHAEGSLADLQAALARFELSLNPRKTDISSLPAELETAWVPELRLFSIAKSPSRQRYDLMRYFARAFQLARQFPDGNVLKYAVSRLDDLTIVGDAWELVQNLVLQCVLSEADVLPRALRFFERRRREKREVDLSKLRQVLEGIIPRQAVAGHGSEVAWALWAAMLYDIPLSSDAVQPAASMDDSAVALMTLGLRDSGAIEGSLDFSTWQPVLGSGALREEHWLVAYEAVSRGWLDPDDPEWEIADDEAFEFLLDQGVHFYDVPEDRGEAMLGHEWSAPQGHSGDF
jgi:hypothetical protein